ncbi:MAG: carboxy terminal-processing peptidase, partial [Opitutaceae bacterium]
MMPTAAFRRSRLAILSLVLASCVSILTAADRTFVTSPTLATEAATLVQLFKNAHFNRANVHLSDYGEVIPDYMAVWDGQHMFFLESDKNAFMKKYNGATVYEQVSQGDIDAAYEIYNLYSDRVEARINWIFNELKKPMNLDENETFARDRSKSEWPATAADSDTLWRLRLKYEIIEELLASKAKPAVTPNLKPKDGEAAPTGTMTIRGIPEAGNAASGAVDNAASPPEQAKDKAEVSAKPVVTADPVTAATEVVRKRYERLLKNMSDIEGGDLAEAYLTSIAALYDPHSNYFSAADYEEFGIQMKLQLVGIGAVLQLKDDFCTIEELVPGGPADLGHQLKPGDRIIAVSQDNQEPVDIIGLQLRKVVAMIRGKKGSRVHLTVEPSGSTDASARKQIVITRDVVKLDSARAHAGLFQVPGADGKTVPVGVITLPEFYGPADEAPAGADKSSASEDVSALISQLKAAGVRGMVLDLRGNGGGYLGEAINVAGLFIPKGPVVQVVDSEGRKQVDSSESDKVAYEGPMAVLTDRFSASASEIVAGALQNYGRAVVIGDSSTHGKGTVQEVIEMRNFPDLALAPDKTGAAKITTQKFYLPNGSSTQLKGVVADIALPSVDDALPIGESSLPHALIWDRKPSAKSFTGQPLDPKFLGLLRELSLARQSKLPEFAYLKKDVDWYSARTEEKLIPLNIDVREKQKADDDAFIKGIKAEREELAKSDYPHTEFWVAPRPAPRIKAPKAGDDASVANPDDDDEDATLL